MKKIIFILILFFLCFIIIAEGVQESSIFELVYNAYIGNDIYICILFCNLTKDLFLVVKYDSSEEGGIGIIKLDNRYSEFLKR